MQDQWYGDKRDLVKWGTLLELAHRYETKHILQILYLRPSKWGKLEIDNEQVELPKAVIQQFRQSISVLSIQCPFIVEVFEESFVDRTKYLQLVLQRIQSRALFPSVVFLDPDTGLEPPSKPGKGGLKHVLEAELAKIWQILRPGDLMVLYQHQTNRNGEAWIEPKKAQFEDALEIGPGIVKIARAPEIAADVAFFYIRK